ncbi:hypothetical protein [Methanoculleus oceani]|uniref:hypothetical protein n=1 Tax=Methanoculleus oceani TaxID=2184756 RepID=UPI002033F531|nr:hypothetical protein [Methanoculleus sp. CWC-02]
MYNGYFGRGCVILIGTFIGSLIFVIPGLIVAIYGIYDAYATAKRMNAGEIPYRATSVLHMILFVFLWVFGIAAFFFLAAIVAALVSGATGAVY